MNKRQSGYYWVKLDVWSIAWYDAITDTWEMDGFYYECPLFYEINETRILNPDEK